MAANYDNSAWFYDRLSQLVFGDALKQAQTYFLTQIPAGAKVLIVGGGTGWILEELAKAHPSGLEITYVEISANMIALSRKRHIGSNKVTFINAPVEEVSPGKAFNVLITPFFFDNYRQANLPKVFDHLHDMLRPGGLWLNTDFKLTGKWWQSILLKSMLLFFKVLCGVESWRLPDVDAQFKQHHCRLSNDKTFFGDFIIAQVYRAAN